MSVLMQRCSIVVQVQIRDCYISNPVSNYELDLLCILRLNVHHAEKGFAVALSIGKTELPLNFKII